MFLFLLSYMNMLLMHKHLCHFLIKNVFESSAHTLTVYTPYTSSQMCLYALLYLVGPACTGFIPPGG